MKSLKESTNDPKEKVIKEFILKQLTYHLESKTNISAAQKSITLVLYLFKFFKNYSHFNLKFSILRKQPTWIQLHLNI